MPTLAGVFRPDLGSLVDSIVVTAYKVSTWTGANNPPQLNDAPPASPPPDGTCDLGTFAEGFFGNYGAWEIPGMDNDDYFVAVLYDSIYYWQRMNGALFDSETYGDATLDVDSLAIATLVTYGLDALTATTDVKGVGPAPLVGGTLGPGGTGPQFAAYVDHVHPGLGKSLQLSGAGSDTRYAGATAIGAPTSGSDFLVGDFVVDQSGAIWVCTQVTPTVVWAEVGIGTSVGATPGDIKAFAGVTVPSGWLACDGWAVSRTTYPELFAALTIGAPGGITGSATLHSSTLVDGIASTAGWEVGWNITGSGIPANTTIASVDSATEIHLSAAATTSGSTTITVAPIVAITSSNTTITNIVPSTTGFEVGWAISGPGIPVGATITSIDSSSEIHITPAATATVTVPVPIVVGPWGLDNGTTTFNLPDLRGRTLVGTGTGTGENESAGSAGDSGVGLPNTGIALSTRVLGGWFGQENHVLSVNELAEHAHSHAHIIDALGLNQGGESGTLGGLLATGGAMGGISADATPAGISLAHNVVQPSTGIRYVIKT